MELPFTAAILVVTAERVKSQRTKHIDIRFKFTKQHHRELKTVQVLYIPSEANAADGFTKPFAHEQHNRFLRLLNHNSIESINYLIDVLRHKFIHLSQVS